MRNNSAARSLVPVVGRYGMAVLFVAAAYGLTLLTRSSFLEAPMRFFFAAVVASAWFCGRGPSWLTVILSALTVSFFFHPPISFLIEFVAFSVAAGWMTSGGKRAKESLKQARDELQMRVAERTAELKQANEQLLAEIAERKQIEVVLRNQADLLDLTHDTIFVRNTKDVITYWNRGAEKLYGWTREEALSNVTHDLLQTVFPVPIEEIMLKLFQTGRWEGDLVHTKRDGTKVTVASRWFLQLDERGQPIATLETNNDITERKLAVEAAAKAQAELAHVTRIMTMGEMAASIAHEVNQPLSGVVINSNACLRWLAGDPPNLKEAREAVQRIVRDGRRAGDVIAGIRALAKKTVLEKERLNINEVIREVVLLAQSEVRRNHAALRMELADDLCPVLGDRVQLQQVVLNLIINGTDAMSTVAGRPRELVITTKNCEMGQVQVTVRDSGTGLDPQSTERIFDAFYTTKPGGMGMGLSISRSIVQSHGGRLWAVANEDAGVTFQFTVPGHD